MRLSFVAVVMCAVLVGSSAVSADVRSDQRVRFQLGGMLGKMVNMFGGKGARDGVVSSVAVKGNRKATMSDSTGQIIDLTEEKIYDLDIKKKTYAVTTFAELRKRMEEARRDAERSARDAERDAAREAGEPSKPAEKDPNAKEVEVDFDVKNTGKTQKINGFDTSETVMTITVREKGKTLDQSGGLVMVNSMWMTPNAPSTKDLLDFDRRYAEKLYGPTVVGASAQDMAMAMAMYPEMKPALDKMRAEGSKMPNGTAILTTMTMESVPPGTANQAAAPPAAPEAPARKGLGGMLGGLKKMAEASQQQNQNAKPARAVVMTTSVEMLKLTTDVDAASVAIPAGFKETK